jgi:hypothetical protein
MASLCDKIIGTNEYLCARLSTVFDKPVTTISNFMNHQQLQASREIIKNKEIKTPERPFTIGYFSGTPSHAKDFGKAAVEIVRLMDVCPEIMLRLVGHLNIPGFMDPFKRAGRISWGSVVDFISLQKEIALVDVNIVPLLDNEFTNCKSELKFFEAAAVGTITCATPTYAYRTSIRTGETGYLCKEGEWYTTLEHIYRNGVDDVMVAEAKDYCIPRYTPPAQLPTIEAALRWAVGD